MQKLARRANTLFAEFGKLTATEREHARDLIFEFEHLVDECRQLMLPH